LMIEYKAQKVAAQNAVLDESRLVKHMMAEHLELGLPVWLGEFYDELESAGVPSEFDLHPGGNYDADAQLKLLRVWRGIGVQIRVTAIKMRSGYRARALKASMSFVWEEERLWGGTLYRKEVSVELPFDENKDSAAWVYVEAKTPVDARALGEALVEALAIETERNAARMKTAAEKEEHDKLSHERGIERADEKAKTAYPGDEARWRAAYEARQAELDKKRIAQKQFDAEVEQATAWLNNWRAVLDANREKLRQAQAQWAHPLACYVLEYGVVAEDEDGDDGEATKHVETRQMYVDASAADEHGNWFEVSRNHRCVRVNHPVRLWTRTFEHDGTAPGELILKLWARDCLEYIEAWVTDDAACVMADLAEAGFAKFPALNISVSRSAWRKALLEDGNYGSEYAVRQELEKVIEYLGEVE
jgi:hypothetical protein